MKRMIWLVVLLCILWTLYWFGMRFMAMRQIEMRTQDLLQTEWSLEHSAYISGFPLWFHLSSENIVFTGPQTDGSITGVNITIPAYDLGYVKLDGLQEISLRTPNETQTITAQDLQANVRIGVLSFGKLKRAQGKAEALNWQFELISSEGTIAAEIANWDVVQRRDQTYDLSFEARSIDINVGCVSGCSPTVIAVPSITLDAEAKTQNPVFLTKPDQSVKIDALLIHSLAIEAFDGRVSLSGAVTFDRDGLASGTLDVNVQNWTALLNHAGELGMIPPDKIGLIRSLLQSVESDDGSVTFPLALRSGNLMFGPFTIAKVQPLISN